MFPVLMMTMVLLASLPALAQSIYKCTVAGKVAYGDRPCDDGVTVQLAAPGAPPPDPDAAARLQRQKALLASMQKQRVASEGQAARARARADKAAALLERRCAKLRLQQRWLEEDVHQVMSEQRTAARHKAQRHRQTMALECPG